MLRPSVTPWSLNWGWVPDQSFRPLILTPKNVLPWSRGYVDLAAVEHGLTKPRLSVDSDDDAGTVVWRASPRILQVAASCVPVRRVVSLRAGSSVQQAALRLVFTLHHSIPFL